jgi:hypothetical protein
MLKLWDPIRENVLVIALFMASIEVRIPTRAAIPMAIIKHVITVLSKLVFTASSPCLIFSLMRI